MAKYSLIVKGMRCAACSGSIRSTIRSIPKTRNIEVNLLTGLVEFSCENKVNIDELIAKINALGFEAEVSKGFGDSLKKSNDFKLPELIIISILGFVLAWISIANMVFTDNPAVPELLNVKLYPIAYLAVTGFMSIPIMIVGTKFFIPGLKSLFKGKPTMESLISIGSLTAFIYSLYWAFIAVVNVGLFVPCYKACMNTIFDSSCMVIVLVYIGKYIEQVHNNKAKKEIKNLIEILPTNANVIRNNQVVEVCINDIIVGETIVVKEGERIPADGVITKGKCLVDKSAITGESELIELKEDDEVLMGSIVTSGNIEFSAIKLTKEATINNILYLVSKAQISKSKKANLIDKITKYFVPVIFAFALVSFAVWMIVTSADLTLSIKGFVTTLVIACPCSIGLAIPLANVNLSTTAIKNGFVFRNSDSVNSANKIDTFVFDKTGTLTDGKFIVEDIKNPADLEDIYKIIYTLESKSTHPIAKSICSYLEKKGVAELIENVDVKLIQGYGLEGKINNKVYRITNSRYLNKEGLDPENLYLSENNEVLAEILLKDNLANHAKELIQYLKSENKEIYILTGDSKFKAERLAKELGIEIIKAEVLPNEKYEFIKELKEKGKHICYVGDGINDAPSLSLSDMSISPYMSSDVASSSSDIYLLTDDLLKIKDIFNLSKLARNIINLNLIWAFSYNLIAMFISLGMFYPLGVKFEPWMGALAMAISSACVISTSLFIKTYKHK